MDNALAIGIVLCIIGYTFIGWQIWKAMKKHEAVIMATGKGKHKKTTNKKEKEMKKAVIVVAAILFAVSMSVIGFADQNSGGGTSSNSNTNSNLSSNFNSNDNSNKTTIGNISGGNGGSVTDNSKTTNTALGGTALSNSSANNNGNLKNVGNSTSNSSVKNSGNSNVKTSTNQGQGQVQGQTQGNGNEQNTNNNAKVYANAWPSVTPAEGTSSGTASSVFGSLGIADTEKYKKIQVILQTLSAEVQAGLVSKDDIAPLVSSLNVKLMGTVKTQRVLGVGPETSGKNLLNLFGLLTFDSYWKDGAKQGGDLQKVANVTKLLNDRK